MQAYRGFESHPLRQVTLAVAGTAVIIPLLLFSIVGFVGYRYGKKASLNTPKWIGVALMFYPYVITNTLLLYLVGCGLCVCLYLYRDRD